MNNLIGEQMNTLYNLARDVKNDTLEEVADKEAVKIKVEDETACEKCGEPTTSKLVGDEWFDYCAACNWTTNN